MAERTRTPSPHTMMQYGGYSHTEKFGKQFLSDTHSTGSLTPRGNFFAMNCEAPQSPTLHVADSNNECVVNASLAAAEINRFDVFMKKAGIQLRRAPRILTVSRRHVRKEKYVDFVGEYHIDLIQRSGGAPIVIPRTACTLANLSEYLPMDGLLVVEGNDMSDEVLIANGCAVPDRLEGEAALKYASDTEFDVAKDEIEFALMRFALESGCPILGLCRGSQMLNVLRGGTLIGDIATEVGTSVCHLKECGPEYDSHRHAISVTPGTPLAEWFQDTLKDIEELQVNSYHHQGVKDLGDSLLPMAYAPDGVLEGFYDKAYAPELGRFVVGLQFHPERMLDDYPGCCRVYATFLEACHAYRQMRK